MEGSTSKVVLLVMGWALMVVIAEAQDLPPCANQLSPCAAYLNSTSPPPNICCNPIKIIDSTEKSCFCELALSPSILQGFGINTAQALQLVQLCGVNFDLTSCEGTYLIDFFLIIFFILIKLY